MESILSSYRADTETWTKEKGLKLSTSYGYACSSELEDGQTIMDLARLADGRMYQAKAEYYQMNGNDRRRK